MDLEALEKSIAARLSPKRMKHTLGCVQTAKALAETWGVDAVRAHTAALLHDMTKEMSTAEQLKFCEKHDIIICDIHKAVPELLHAVTGAKAAVVEFGVSEEVAGAILHHTTACADMSMLEKVIWIADMTEPGRSFPGVEDIRRVSRTDIDLAIIMGIDRTVEYLIEKGQMIDPAMLEARNFLIGHRRA